MTDTDDGSDDLFDFLESDTATVAMLALLKEWISQNTHKLAAFALSLKFWSEQMGLAGYSQESIEATLPMMIERLWTLPFPE